MINNITLIILDMEQGTGKYVADVFVVFSPWMKQQVHNWINNEYYKLMKDSITSVLPNDLTKKFKSDYDKQVRDFISPMIFTLQALKLNKFGSKYKSYANALINNEVSTKNSPYKENSAPIKQPILASPNKLILVIQSLNSQVQALTTLLEDICEATTFQLIEQVWKQKILNTIKNPEFIAMQSKISKYVKQFKSNKNKKHRYKTMKNNQLKIK